MAGVTELDKAIYNADGTGTIADNRTTVDGVTPDEATAVLTAGSDGTNAIPIKVAADGTVATSATITGDVNVDNNSMGGEKFIGKAAGLNADFITAYASGTTLTCSTLPTSVAAINLGDIVSIMQINAAGTVVATYTRDDATMLCAGADPTTITVTGATFGATDTFIVYTNISRWGAVGAAEDVDGVIHAQLRFIGEAVATVEGLLGVGTGVMASAQAVTIATDDTQFGAVGSAADVDGNIHGQLEFIGTAASEIEGATETIEGAIVTDEDTHSATSMQVAGHYAAAPVELTDGDASAILIDAFRRIQQANFDGATGTGLVTDLTSVSGVPMSATIPQLDAAGNSAAVNVEGYYHHTFAVTIASIDTSVEYHFEGSIDGGTVFDNIAEGGVTETETANDTLLYKYDGAFTHVRLVFDAEVGGAAVTLDCLYRGSN